jgi:N-acetylmuramoyl-L-alanine amidase-like protein
MAGSSVNVRHLRAIGALCQDAGLRVVEADGWENRGRTWSVLRPDYVVCHHTAASIDVDKLLIDGRSDLPGPLCNLALHRDDTVVLIASGLANHAGTATISSDQAWGIEATGPIPVGNTGIDAFPNYQAYVTLVAAIRLHHGWGSGRVLSHKEIARPDGRKRDPDFGDPPPAPYTDMDRFRAEVEGRVRTWGTSEEDDMFDADAEKRLKEWIEGRLDLHTAEVVKRVEDLYRLAARGEQNGTINRDSTHYADSVRGTREAVLDALREPPA